ncbi:hypothetical protein BJ508DRAFT_337109 [Ascobolus immersus RN42]|uniref:Uncharacterized protein n=1 Tax=Ascobolus immersus RN42 TaxID=1160509 RepID=A0A3N4H909_ASCIM|nr:hypothetical protein BJ508DRAFT_337109 [Ascobolus immersus RN42]
MRGAIHLHCCQDDGKMQETSGISTKRRIAPERTFKRLPIFKVPAHRQPIHLGIPAIDLDNTGNESRNNIDDGKMQETSGISTKRRIAPERTFTRLPIFKVPAHRQPIHLGIPAVDLDNTDNESRSNIVGGWILDHDGTFESDGILLFTDVWNAFFLAWAVYKALECCMVYFCEMKPPS